MTLLTYFLLHLLFAVATPFESDNAKNDGEKEKKVSINENKRVYDYNITCVKAYQELLKLKINNGKNLINQAKKENPQNLIPVFLDCYVDFFTLFFDEDAQLYKPRKETMLQHIEDLETGPSKSVYYNYCLSQANYFKGLILLKYGDLWAGGWAFRHAFLLIKENNTLYPNFSPNRLLYGSLEAIMGSMPSNYNFLAGLLGLKGSISEGMGMVTSFLNENSQWSKMMNNEATFLYCYLKFFIENKRAESLDYVKSGKVDYTNNHLMAFLASTLALSNNDPSFGKTVIEKKSNAIEFMPLTVWDYMMGNIYLYHLDYAEAEGYYLSYLARFKGIASVKEVLLKLSWCYYLNGKLELAIKTKQKILKNNETGGESDKLAKKEALKIKWPNPILLKARLLNDGGYNVEALNLLLKSNAGSFKDVAEYVEYYYRKGRVLDDLHRDGEALIVYDTAIALGKNRSEYFAARAAVQSGIIYERLNNHPKAVEMFKLCLALPPHDFKNSLDQKAKNGLARCKR